MLFLLKRVRRLLWTGGLAAALLASGPQAVIAGGTAPEGQQRIVSVGGDITEIIFALGQGERIVAVDTTSQYPAEAVKEKKSVGYMRALSTEGVLSVTPTLIIASGDAGPPEVVAALKGSTVPFVEVKTDDTPDGVLQKIVIVAETLGIKSEGEKIAARVRGEFETSAAERAKVTKPVRALFILALREGRAIVAGNNTSAGSIFALAGAVNAVTGFEGYKPLSDEAAITAAPDVIVVMQRSDGAGKIAQEIGSMKGLASTPAVKSGRIIEVDGSYMLQFGPRAGVAVIDLMRGFYPDLAQASGQAERK